MPGHYDQSDIRKQLLARGYAPIFTRGKIPSAGWNKPDFAAREYPRIWRWHAVHGDKAISTGIRVQQGVAFGDNDSDDEQMAREVWELVHQIAPGVAAGAPLRYGKGWKFGFVCRLAELPTEYRGLFAPSSNEWKKPGDAEDAPTHRMEFFISDPESEVCKRQFVCYGPHTVGPAGEVLIEYTFAPSGPALHEVARDELPVITLEQVFAILTGFDKLAEARGWIKVVPDSTGGPTTYHYDITEATRFDGLAYDELTIGARCSAAFIDDKPHRRTDRCKVMVCETHKVIGVWDFRDCAWHLPADRAPPTPEQLQALLGLAAATVQAASSVQAQPVLPKWPKSIPARPADNATLVNKVGWLIATHAYCRPLRAVVELYAPNEDCLSTLDAFKVDYAAWAELQPANAAAGRPKAKFVAATSLWTSAISRLSVRGVRMHPGMPFPLFTGSDGYLYKNTYQRPAHLNADQGVLEPWFAFMDHLLPARRERDWFEDWLAHKVQHPEVPSTAVIMVAADDNGPVYGAGRGMLFSVISRLFGEKYVKNVEFDVLVGRLAQSREFNDWAAYALLVTVNEALDTADAGRWNERRAAYESFKNRVDPRAGELRNFRGKYKGNFEALCFASYIIASNNRDAVQIQANDRRLTVLSNGGVMSTEMAQVLTDWMEQSENIAALDRYLRARTLDHYNAYQPLPTEAKTLMQELAASELDEEFAAIRRRLGKNALFTGEMVSRAMQNALGYDNYGSSARAYVRRRIRADAQKAPSRVQNLRYSFGGREERVLCWRSYNGEMVGSSAAAKPLVEASQSRLDGKQMEEDPADTARVGLGVVSSEYEKREVTDE